MPNVFLRIAKQSDSLFLYECYKNSCEQNRFDPLAIDFGNASSIYDNIKNHVNERNIDNELYIVNKNGKDVGFFSAQYNSVSLTVGGVVFVHPRACKMAIITLIKCLVLFDILLCLSGPAVYISINVWHDYLIQSVLLMLPGCTTSSFLPNQTHMNSRSEHHKSYYEGVILAYEVTNVQKDGCFECTL